jgi:hypothetical protein
VSSVTKFCVRDSRSTSDAILFCMPLSMKFYELNKNPTVFPMNKTRYYEVHCEYIFIFIWSNFVKINAYMNMSDVSDISFGIQTCPT